MFFIHFQVC